MESFVEIFNPTIQLVRHEARNVNGTPGARFFFTRMSVDTTYPIEIGIVRFGGVVRAYSPQLNGVLLDDTVVDGKNVFAYKNDIIIDKDAISAALDELEEETFDNATATVVEQLFGININGVDGISGLEFDRVLYIDRLDSDKYGNYYDGYVFVFRDIATGLGKFSIFAGKLMPYTAKDYIDELNDYTKSRLLSEITVENLTNKTIVHNNTPFRVEIGISKYTYSPKRVAFDDKHYSYKEVDEFSAIIEPGSSLELVHEKPQREQIYSLFDNAITPPKGDVYVRDTNAYKSALQYINEEPFEISFKSVLSMVGVENPGRYFMVSSLYDLYKDRDNFKYAILDTRNDVAGMEIHGDYGTVVITDSEKLKTVVSGEQEGVFADRMRVMFKTTLRKIYSHLGDDQFNAIIDYTSSSSRTRVLSIQQRTVFNDTISMPQQAVVVTIGLLGNMNEVMKRSSHVEYEKLIKEGDLACKTERKSLVKKLIGSDVFTADYVKIGANDVVDSPTKKVYQGPLYKTYDGEYDDAYELYQQRLNKELDGFSMADISTILSSKEFATVEPLLNMDRDYSEKCREDFVLSIEEAIAELGLEVSLNYALEQMRRAAYVYRQEEEIIATVTLGMTLDGEYYFCGEDFFPAHVIENNEYTTFMDNDIVTLSREMAEGKSPIYDKKEFFDSNDFNDDYKQQLHDMFKAVVLGVVNTSTINDNPGLRYIAEHLFDRSRKLSFSYDDLFVNARESVFRHTTERIQNTIMVPNIFKMLLTEDKITKASFVGDSDIHYFGKERIAYLRNYSDLGISDAYDSAYKIGHTVDVLMNFENIKKAASLFSWYGKSIFGVNVSKFMVVDSIDVQKKENVFIDGFKYGFVLDVTTNGERSFAVAYDYKTKRMKVVLENGAKIVNYPLLLASFDIIVHDYYKVLEGYKRVALGVYAPFEDSTGGKISQKFLYTNSRVNAEPERKTLLLTASAYGSSVKFVPDEDSSSQIDVCEDVNGRTVTIDVSVQNGKLIVESAGESSNEISVLSISNMPMKKTVIGGVVLAPHRVSLHLPVRHYNKSLTRATIIVAETSYSTEYASSLLGEIRVVDFADYDKFSINGVGDHVFALGGEGLIGWSEYKGYTTEEKILVDIDSVFEHINEGVTVAIDGITYRVEFE